MARYNISAETIGEARYHTGSYGKLGIGAKPSSAIVSLEMASV